MFAILWIVTILVTKLYGCCLDDKVNYYESLINTKVNETQNYKLPESNEEFRSGYNSNKITVYGTFDFIVVGAGTAGSILATRLSEIRNWTVLVLEAGGDQDDFTQIPSYSYYVIKSNMNWGYLTTTQNNSCLAMNNHQCAAPRGKVIGGTNVINGMAYVRGHSTDFDEWSQMGNPGWSWNDIFPYYIKMENSQIDGEPGWHGEDGEWNVEYNGPLSKTVPIFFKSANLLNVSHITDYNSENSIGVSRLQYNEKYGQRLTTATAYLTNAEVRSNVNITQRALVTKIVIDDNKNATGVEFVLGNKRFRALASKEVLISAGAYNTPQLLMLSGIGPKEELDKHKIDVIVDSPVGEDLIDHPYFIGLLFSTNFTESLASISDLPQYLQGYGPLTVPFNMQVVGFLGNNESIPQVEYLFETQSSSNSIFYNISNIQEQYTKQIFDNSSHLRLGVFISLLHEKSRGSVKLKSSNPIDFPLINTNLFTDENNDDVKTITQTVRFLQKLMNTEPFQQINTTLIKLPFCQDNKEDSDEYWECAIRHLSITLFHPCGTAKMGTNGVVDENLKVRGIQNLRILDASVIPVTISGHTNAPTALVAEKGSEIIKNSYGKKSGCPNSNN